MQPTKLHFQFWATVKIARQARIINNDEVSACRHWRNMYLRGHVTELFIFKRNHELEMALLRRECQQLLKSSLRERQEARRQLRQTV